MDKKTSYEIDNKPKRISGYILIFLIFLVLFSIFGYKELSQVIHRIEPAKNEFKVYDDLGYYKRSEKTLDRAIKNAESGDVIIIPAGHNEPMRSKFYWNGREWVQNR